MFNDPTGAKSDKPKNAASFNNAGELLDFLKNNGIDKIENGHEFMWWSFSDAADDGGGGGLVSFFYGDKFSFGTNKNGEQGIRLNWSGSYNDGNGNTLNTVIKSTQFVRIQNLWNGAMQYGENHRDASREWFNGAQHYDVMWQHNYDNYMDRVRRGSPLSQAGDRVSYTEGLGQFGNVNRAHVEGRIFEAGFVAVMAAPLAIYAAAEAGVGAAISSAYSATASGISEISLMYTEAEIGVYGLIGNLSMEAKIGFSIFGGMVSNQTLRLNGQQLYNALSSAMQASPYDNSQAIRQIIRVLPPFKGIFSIIIIYDRTYRLTKRESKKIP